MPKSNPHVVKLVYLTTTETEAIFIYFPPFIDYAKYEEYTLLGMYGELLSGAELSYQFPWEFLYRTFI